MKKEFNMKNIIRDIFIGIMIAAVSIPIGMGYAQIAGLPAVYGLYGSVLPILVFALFSSSPQFIFGVDAAPAALIGGVLITLGIEAGSVEAVQIIPVLTVYTSAWLFIFYIFKAGRLVNYISSPVMGGFITGIGTTIIFMQIPKLMGSTSGSGELFELIHHIVESLPHINWISMFMGIAALTVILVSKRLAPRFPMSLLVMVLGAMSTIFLHVDNYGVALLSQVERGLPALIWPDFGLIHFKDGFMLSLPIAVVILSESLLAETSFAIKNGYKINDNREILAFSLSNLSAAIVGCCPVNGSVSRTVMGEQYGAKTKIVSVTASICMAAVLLFATQFIGYLPVPVLTAIVIAALIGVLETHLAVRLYKINKTEFVIFMGAFIAVLILGTIYGVVVGLLLSFSAMIVKSAVPPRGYLGIIPGKDGFYDLNRSRDAIEVSGAVIYRFSGSLFFANINTFQEDIEKSVKDDTKVVIIDAGGINSIDITAADRLEMIYKNFKERNIEFYITEHIGQLNDELRKLGLGYLVEDGVVRRNIRAALSEAGMIYSKESMLKEEIFEEFEWAFGDDADEQMEKHAQEIVNNITKCTSEFTPETDIDLKARAWRHLGAFDQDMLLEHLERHLNEIASRLGQPVDAVEANIMEHRIKLEEKMERENKAVYEHYVEKRKKYEEFMKLHNSQLHEYIMEHRRRQYELLKENKPEIAEHIKKWIH